MVLPPLTVMVEFTMNVRGGSVIFRVPRVSFPMLPEYLRITPQNEVIFLKLINEISILPYTLFKKSILFV